MAFEQRFYTCNGLRIHAMEAGRGAAGEERPVMVMLHGFPEYWAAWASVAERLSKRFHTILPDQRGFNLSDKPAQKEAYDTKHLVADMLALIDQVSPDRPIILCGHDWGASVAYALAMRHAERVSHLIIANGVHPMCFQKALFAGGPQTHASQYMNVLRAKGSEAHLSANRFEKLLRMLEKFSQTDWMDEATRDAYRAAWGQEGAMSAMLNWYRGSPMVVPESGSPPKAFDITEEMQARFRLTMPHLLLWGNADTALLMEAREDLPLFCDDLTVRENEQASHWILHEDPSWAAHEIVTFLDR